MSESSPQQDGSSQLQVGIVIAVIVLGAGGWVTAAFLSGGGPAPERAEKLGEEAERECVLEGVDYDRCPELIGPHHRSCLREATTREADEGDKLDRDIYMSCIRRHFQDVDAGSS